MTIPVGWTSREIATLREHASEGAAACARLLGRTVGSVKMTAQRQRISLRRPGSRRGLVLGQPRNVSLKREMREQLLAGTVDPAVLAERARLDYDAALCPSCAMRPVITRRHGRCAPCQMRALTAIHRELLAEEEATHAAQQELWSSRQQLKRSRDRRAAEVRPKGELLAASSDG